MNAQTLFSLKDEEYKHSGIYFCSNCRIVHRKQEDAEKCCKCIYCDKLVEEKRPDQNGSYIYHDKCFKTENAKIRNKFEEDKFAKATKITAKEWAQKEHSWIFSESYSSNEGYRDIHDFIDQFGDGDLFCPECGEEPEAKALDTEEDKDNYLECKCGWKSPPYQAIDDIIHLFLPKYVWATEFEPVQLDIDRILENVLEHHYEDCEAKGYEELKIAIDKFNDQNKNNGSYNVNYKIAITNLEELM